MINDATKSTECDDTSAYRSDKILIFKTHRPNIYNTGLDTFHKKLQCIHTSKRKRQPSITCNYCLFSKEWDCSKKSSKED